MIIVKFIDHALHMPYVDVVIFDNCSEDFINEFLTSREGTPLSVENLSSLSDISGLWQLIREGKTKAFQSIIETSVTVQGLSNPLFFESIKASDIPLIDNILPGTSNVHALTVSQEECYYEVGSVGVSRTIPDFKIWVKEDDNNVLVYTETEEDALQLRLMR